LFGSLNIVFGGGFSKGFAGTHWERWRGSGFERKLAADGTIDKVGE
jgi:hypothetical protein